MVFIPSEFLPEYRPVRKISAFSTRGWWLNRWPPLGWMETFIKIAAWFFVPYIILDGATPASVSQLPSNFAFEIVIMLAASSLLTLAIIDRIVYREIISMVFVFPNNWAHWSITLAMLRYGRNGVNLRYFRMFCWLSFTGDIVKLIFFAYHDFSRLNVARYFLYLLVALFAVMYLVVLLLDYGYVRISELDSDRLAPLCKTLVVPALIKLQSIQDYFNSR